MDLDLDCEEVIFAQKLASGEPSVRGKAFAKLEQWLKLRSRRNEFTETDIMKLWKGLYYSFWLQDKPLLQEQLADKFSNLLGSFARPIEVLNFLAAHLRTLKQEWYNIDRWRLDKYMMLMRRYFRRHLTWLAENRWDDEKLCKTIEILGGSVLSADKAVCPEGMKFHFAALFLDELEEVGGGALSAEQVAAWLAPYIDLLRNRNTSDQLFDAIVSEIFETIIKAFSAETMKSVVDEEDQAPNVTTAVETNGQLKFDYAAIGQQLFSVGSAKSIGHQRRLILYDLTKKFRTVAAGRDPFDEQQLDDGSSQRLKPSEISSAAERYIEMQKAVPKKRKFALAGDDDAATPEESADSLEETQELNYEPLENTEVDRRNAIKQKKLKRRRQQLRKSHPKQNKTMGKRKNKR